MIFYNGEKLRSLKCDYNIIIGGRGNGKSYDTAKFFIDDYFKNKNLFALIKRVGYGVAKSSDGLMSWFCDDLQNYCLQKYNHYIVAKGDIFYLVDKNEEYKELEGRQRVQRLNIKPFGYFFSLQNEQKYKSSQFDGVNNLCFEEFCPLSNFLYFDDEIEKFTSLISTIVRHRKNAKVFLIGNTINKHNLYFDWLGIDIDKLNLRSGDIKKLVCTEYKNGATIGIEFAKMSYENDDEIPRLFKVGKSECATTGEYLESKYVVTKDDEKFIFKNCNPQPLFAIEVDNILYYYFTCFYKNYKFNYISKYSKQIKICSKIIHIDRSIFECIKLGHYSINDFLNLTYDTINNTTIFADDFIEYRYSLILKELNI